VMPQNITLFDNYPNPFNPSTAIRYALAGPGYVTLSIHNTLGQKVRKLVGHYQNAGEYTVQWNGENDSTKRVTSGIYFYRLAVSDPSGTFTAEKKMLFLK